MKTTFISILSLLLCLNAVAQSNFYKLSLGGGGGFTQSFTDYQKHKFGKSLYGVGEFFFTPFISLGGEGQIGRIKGENDNTREERQYINSYKSGTLNGKIYLGAFINYDRNRFSNIIKGLYFGAGIGGILNDVSSIVNRKVVEQKTKDIIVPLNLGISFYFPNKAGYYRYGVNVNYQSTFSLGDGIDGLEEDPLKYGPGSETTGRKPNSHTDMYNYFSVGLRYNFGPMGLSKKTLY